MRNNFLVVLALFLVCVFASCEELFEKDLKDDWVYAIAPEDFSTVNSQTPILSWEKVKGAISYNLKIYSTLKGYNVTTGLIVDTNVTGTQFTQSLKSGYYKWDIYAQNGSSRSGLSVFRFQVDSIADITNQMVIIESPKGDAAIDTLSVEFKWYPLINATKYNVQIFDNKLNTIGGKDVDKNQTNYTYNFVKGGKYTWRIIAFNGTFSSQPSEATFTIDTIHIDVPVVLSPKNDTTGIHTQPVVFRWNPVPNVTNYYIEVAKDTTIGKVEIDTTYTTSGTGVFYQNYYNSTLSQKYYWRIRALRGAAKGSFSSWWYFRRNP